MLEAAIVFGSIVISISVVGDDFIVNDTGHDNNIIVSQSFKVCTTATAVSCRLSLSCDRS